MHLKCENMSHLSNIHLSAVWPRGKVNSNFELTAPLLTVQTVSDDKHWQANLELWTFTDLVVSCVEGLIVSLFTGSLHGIDTKPP